MFVYGFGKMHKNAEATDTDTGRHIISVTHTVITSTTHDMGNLMGFSRQGLSLERGSMVKVRGLGKYI